MKKLLALLLVFSMLFAITVPMMAMADPGNGNGPGANSGATGNGQGNGNGSAPGENSGGTNNGGATNDNEGGKNSAVDNANPGNNGNAGTNNGSKPVEPPPVVTPPVVTPPDTTFPDLSNVIPAPGGVVPGLPGGSLPEFDGIQPFASNGNQGNGNNNKDTSVPTTTYLKGSGSNGNFDNWTNPFTAGEAEKDETYQAWHIVFSGKDMSVITEMQIAFTNGEVFIWNKKDGFSTNGGGNNLGWILYAPADWKIDYINKGNNNESGSFVVYGESEIKNANNNAQFNISGYQAGKEKPDPIVINKYVYHHEITHRIQRPVRQRAFTPIYQRQYQPVFERKYKPVFELTYKPVYERTYQPLWHRVVQPYQVPTFIRKTETNNENTLVTKKNEGDGAFNNGHTYVAINVKAATDGTLTFTIADSSPDNRPTPFGYTVTIEGDKLIITLSEGTVTNKGYGAYIVNNPSQFPGNAPDHPAKGSSYAFDMPAGYGDTVYLYFHNEGGMTGYASKDYVFADWQPDAPPDITESKVGMVPVLDSERYLFDRLVSICLIQPVEYEDEPVVRMLISDTKVDVREEPGSGEKILSYKDMGPGASTKGGLCGCYDTDPIPDGDYGVDWVWGEIIERGFCPYCDPVPGNPEDDEPYDGPDFYLHPIWNPKEHIEDLPDLETICKSVWEKPIFRDLEVDHSEENRIYRKAYIEDKIYDEDYLLPVKNRCDGCNQTDWNHEHAIPLN